MAWGPGAHCSHDFPSFLIFSDFFPRSHLHRVARLNEIVGIANCKRLVNVHKEFQEKRRNVAKSGQKKKGSRALTWDRFLFLLWMHLERHFQSILNNSFPDDVPTHRRSDLCRGGIWTRRASEVYRSRSWLYRSQILQENTHVKALAEIHTIHSFALL